MTKDHPYEVGFQMVDTLGTSRRAWYRHFQVKNNVTFDLDIDSFDPSSELFVGDSFSALKDKPFSTSDNDNDGVLVSNCAAVSSPGW